ncbi:MAG: hypothetical protein B6242_08910 [Anaerolineaceae bacterium 4572_78]|nr:MAG: hypothetical protein B6242_08910 [Anaerolineaceae bacterium 4572_78]
MRNDLSGRILDGKYQVLKLIGAGGMGEVWQAHDHVLSREVAIKIMLPQYASEEWARDAFVKEAQVIANLDHPNILPVYTLEKQLVESENLVFLAMKLAKGGSLADLLDSGSLQLDEADYILTQTCDAISYAHKEGIIHLDLKPSNILFDNEGRVQIVDFGLAKLIVRTTNPKAETNVGTPHYMAPEQIFGSKVGRFSDVYALGVTLYQMLTGHLPPRDWSGKIVFDQSTLPLAVQTVIKQAVEPDPKKRYHTVRALGQAFSLVS